MGHLKGHRESIESKYQFL